MGSANGELGPDRSGGGGFPRQSESTSVELILVTKRDLAAPGVEGIQFREEHPQYGGLNFVETAISSRFGGNVALSLAVLTEGLHAISQLTVRSEDRATVVHATEVFSWIELKAARVPHVPTF